MILTNAVVLISLGVIFIVSLLIELVGRKAHLPRVTLLILFGFILGPSVLHIIPTGEAQSFKIMVDIALAMVGFLLGGKLTQESFRRYGRQVIWISIAEVVITSSIVFLGLLLLGVSIDMALILAGIAAATAPAATTDVVHELHAQGGFTNTLLGVVAFDDAWALIIFGCLLALAQTFYAHDTISKTLLMMSWEVIGAIVLGIVLGIPMAYLTGRIHNGEPTLIEALGMVFVCSGLALWLNVSYLLSCMALGCVVANFAKHHNRPFHAIEGIGWPFMVIFFVYAGYMLDIKMLIQAGWIVFGYIILRIMGRFIGAYLGGFLGHASSTLKHWMGLALLPQAGVAIGMAVVAMQFIPSFEEKMLPVVLGSTVFFEILGPISTRIALLHVHEVVE